MYVHLKRWIDIIVSFGIIILISPFLIIFALIIYIEDWGNPIFVQTRCGQNKQPFEIYKFRTMPVNTPSVESKQSGSLSITRIGKFLRRSNFDELPQLFNVLLGDMSLIGPRPPLMSQEDLIKLRVENGSIKLKPGMTGLAQINSFENMSADAKANYDGRYVREMSLFQDVKIIFGTIKYFTKKPPVY